MKKLILFSVLGVFLHSAPGYTMLGRKALVDTVASAKILLDLTKFQKAMEPQEYDGQIQSGERKELQDMLNTINSPEGKKSAKRLARTQKTKEKRTKQKDKWDTESNQGEMPPKPAQKEDGVAPCSAESTSPEEAPSHVSANAKRPKERAAASGEKVVAQPVRTKSLGDDGPKGGVFHPPVRRKTKAAPPAATSGEKVVAQPVRTKSLGDDGPKGGVFYPHVRRKTKAAPTPEAEKAAREVAEGEVKRVARNNKLAERKKEEEIAREIAEQRRAENKAAEPDEGGQL